MSDTVTPDVIRDALGELDTSALDDPTLQAAIDYAEMRVAVEEETNDHVSANARYIATVDIAKYRAYTANKEAFISSVKSSSDTTDFRIQEKVDNLRADKEEALALLRTSRIGAATVGDRGRKSGSGSTWHRRGDKRKWW